MGGSGLALPEPQASLARPRPKRAPQVPVAPAEGADSGGAFLLVTFLLRKRKVTAPPGAHPGQGSHGRQLQSATPHTANKPSNENQLQREFNLRERLRKIEHLVATHFDGKVPTGQEWNGHIGL